jgi:hypothetical protein
VPPLSAPLPREVDAARRTRTRRLALLLALVAAGVYAGSIALQLMRAKGA